LSIEFPEAYILSKQMSKVLEGKEIIGYDLHDCEKLQKIGFINKDSSDFNRLCGCKIESIVARGTVVLVKLDNEMNLLLAPEYGGKILYHTREKTIPSKFHLRLCFKDNTILTVTLTGMGVIQALKNEELGRSYVYERDFSTTISTLDTEEFTYENFSKALADKNVNVKSALVGKDATIVGLSNSAFQDILYHARIHPKRKASDLNYAEKHALYDAIKLVVQERIKLGGKDQFTDLHGKQGTYIPAMGPNMKDKACPACGAQVEKMSLGGGQAYFCPSCQR
jgi:formamidopyrimidine-DNA glycosylase